MCVAPFALSNIVFRTYRPEDEKACEHLEERANQFRSTKLQDIFLIGGLLQRLKESMIQVKMSHGNCGFDARTQFAQDSEVIVGEYHGTIIAVVLINIQTVWFHEQLLRAGWVYGLRVDQDYQRQGIGTRLMQEAERRCIQKDVALLYLSVNTENAKARAFYNALGYQPASTRLHSAVILMNEEKKCSDSFVVVRISAGLAAVLMRRHYHNQNLALFTEEAFQELFHSSDYEGTFLAVPKSHVFHGMLLNKEISTAVEAAVGSGKISSYGAVSLWNTSTLKGIRVVRFLFKKETWLSRPFQVSLVTAAATPLVLWGFKLVGRTQAAAQSRSNHCQAGWLALEMMGYGIVVRCVYKITKFVRFILTRDSQRLQAKAFGIFRQGPQGQECLEHALVASRNYARSQRYGMWLLNEDERHPDRPVFPKSGFQTLWMQKWLQPTIDKEWKAFSPAIFCDPRNL
jgi:GNAT superfamily N-acetyltransferase